MPEYDSPYDVCNLSQVCQSTVVVRIDATCVGSLKLTAACGAASISISEVYDALVVIHRAYRVEYDADANVRTLMKEGKLSGETRTAYNVPLERLWANTPKHLTSHWNQELKRFEDRTSLRRPGGLSVSGRENFAKWKEIPAYTKNHTTRDPSMYRLLAYIGQISAAGGAYCTADPDGISEGIGKILINAPSTRREFLQGAHRCRKSHLVVIDALARLHEPPPNELLLVHLLYIVARGLPVTTHAIVSEKKEILDDCDPMRYSSIRPFCQRPLHSAFQKNSRETVPRQCSHFGQSFHWKTVNGAS